MVVSVLLGRGVAVQSGGSGGHVSDTTGAHSVTCSGLVARGVVCLLCCVEVSSSSCVIPLTYCTYLRVKLSGRKVAKCPIGQGAFPRACDCGGGSGRAGRLSVGLVVGASHLRHQGIST